MADMTCKQVGPDCPLDGSSLGYAPNIGASAVFTVLFSLSYVCHLTLGWKYKTWTFMIAMLLGSTSEVVGYIGRILMHNNPYRLSTYVCPSSVLPQGVQLFNPLCSFLTQIVCLTTAPAFYSAGIYLCLSRMQVPLYFGPLILPRKQQHTLTQS
jgi:hypothetical protein